MNLFSFGALAATLAAPLLSSCSTGGNSSMSTLASMPDARQVVLDFYRDALIERRPQAAFSKYVAQSFIEHKPDVASGTREAAAQFLAELIAGLPEARWEIVRTVSDGHFVVIHAKFTPAPGASPYAIADFFRVEQGLIVEHWDVVAGPPRSSANPHSRF